MTLSPRNTLHRLRLAAPALALGLLLLGGCTQTGDQSEPGSVEGTPAPAVTVSDIDHHEDHVAPHGGALNGLTDELAHLEAVLDPENGQMVVYVLDGRAAPGMRIMNPEGLKLSVREPVETEIVLEPVEDSLTGETADDTSRFQATSELLKGAESLEATVESIEIQGKVYEQTLITWPVGTDDHHHDHDHDHDHE